MPSHEVKLVTTLFEGSFQFTDSNGAAITTLKLDYGGGGACPEPSKYRIVNTGNVTDAEFTAPTEVTI